MDMGVGLAGLDVVDAESDGRTLHPLEEHGMPPFHPRGLALMPLPLQNPPGARAGHHGDPSSVGVRHPHPIHDAPPKRLGLDFAIVREGAPKPVAKGK